MASTTINSSGVTFPDATVQATAATASSYAGNKGQAFTANGTFTIPTGVTAIKVTVIGGGGGGNASWGLSNSPEINGPGGGGGGTAISYLTGLTSGNTLAVTIGAAGTGRTSYGGSGPGGNGGDTTVASGTQTITTITGGGGKGGNTIGGGANAGIPGIGGAGGTATNGTINITGGGGGIGLSTGGGPVTGGQGGSTTLAGNVQSPIGASTGSTGTVYGGGGGGGSSSGSNSNGGNGAAGVVIFEW
jgi:hypothetical protein